MPQEIPRAQWPSFFGSFGHGHSGCRVTLEFQQPGRGKVIAAENWALENMLTDSAPGHDQISIVLGEPQQPHFTHVVDNPTHVRLGRLANEEDLEIDAGDGSVTVVRVRAA